MPVMSAREALRDIERRADAIYSQDAPCFEDLDRALQEVRDTARNALNAHTTTEQVVARDLFAITNEQNNDLMWSSESGWVANPTFTLFTPEDREQTLMPIGGRWVQLTFC